MDLSRALGVVWADPKVDKKDVLASRIRVTR